MTRKVVLDTETTGLDPAEGHRIIEIGCVELVDNLPTGRTWHALLDPERDVPAESSAVHGITTEALKGKPVFADEADGLLVFLEDSPLVIHNAAFDLGFLNAELRRMRREPLPQDRAIDTVALARSKRPGSPASLDALCRAFGIDLSVRSDRHGALIDANLLAQVYLELEGGRQQRLSLGSDERAGQAGGEEAQAAVEPARTEPREARPHQPTAEEAAAHAEMVGRIQSPVWRQ